VMHSVKQALALSSSQRRTTRQSGG
jgi:hypothetical protein